MKKMFSLLFISALLSTAEAQYSSGNLIVNGDFNAGAKGFVSGYNWSQTNTTEGEIYVAKNAKSWNIGLENCPDHSTGNGNMLFVNGAPIKDVVVWNEKLKIEPNSIYTFSCWLQPLFVPNPARLRFSINGKDLGNLLEAELPLCNWKKFYATWNSGNNTTASISILNKNTEIQGNDFALDDIFFGTTTCPHKRISSAKFTYQVTDQTVSFELDNKKANAASNLLWNFGDASLIKNKKQVFHTYKKPGKYKVKLIAQNVNGCPDTISKIIFIPIHTEPVIIKAGPVDSVSDKKNNKTINSYEDTGVIKQIPSITITDQSNIIDTNKISELIPRKQKAVKYIEVSHDSLTVTVYDNAEIDGDSVTLIYNNNIIVRHLLLTDKPYTFRLKINPGKTSNEFVMYAENLGSIPPNTALMVIYDGEKRYEVSLSSNMESNGMIIFSLRK